MTEEELTQNILRLKSLLNEVISIPQFETFEDFIQYVCENSTEALLVYNDDDEDDVQMYYLFYKMDIGNVWNFYDKNGYVEFPSLIINKKNGVFSSIQFLNYKTNNIQMLNIPNYKYMVVPRVDVDRCLESVKEYLDNIS